MQEHSISAMLNNIAQRYSGIMFEDRELVVSPPSTKNPYDDITLYFPQFNFETPNDKNLNVNIDGILLIVCEAPIDKYNPYATTNVLEMVSDRLRTARDAGGNIVGDWEPPLPIRNIMVASIAEELGDGKFVGSLGLSVNG